MQLFPNLSAAVAKAGSFLLLDYPEQMLIRHLVILKQHFGESFRGITPLRASWPASASPLPDVAR